MSVPPTTYSLDYLAEATGKSAKFWEREAASRNVPHRRFGKTPRFTVEDLQTIFDRHLVQQKDEATAAPKLPVDSLASRVTRGGRR